MVKYINSVDKSNDGKRTFATDVEGNPMFGRTPAITSLLKVGAFANVVEQLQTKTRDADGNLVDLEPAEQRKLWIVTGVFANEDEALVATTQSQLFEVKQRAYIKSQEHKIAETYKVAGSLADAI